MDVSPYKMLQNIGTKTEANPVPRAHEVGIVYFTVWRLFRLASKITMFAYFVVENPRFPSHFMADARYWMHLNRKYI